MLEFKELEELKEKGIISLTTYPQKEKNHLLVIIDKKREIGPSQWEKIKRRLKKIGFKYVAEDGGWYCDFKNGKWEPSFSE